MNSQLIQQGRAAYRAGDYSAAAQMLGAAKTPGEIMGEADHLRGNALMHLGMYAEAAEAYAAALNDGTYGKRGALLTNRGKALAAVGDYVTAAQAFLPQRRMHPMPRRLRPIWVWATPYSSRAIMPTPALPSVRPPSMVPTRLPPPPLAILAAASLSSAVRQTP
mgnify:CR=1 FL=1